MDKIYSVSDKHTGPWRGEEERPDQALDVGRALWGVGKILYVAEVRAVKASDGFPSAVVLAGDIREALVEKFGRNADSMFDDAKVMKEFERRLSACSADIDAAIELVHEPEFMAAVKVKSYSPNNSVRTGDFR